MEEQEFKSCYIWPNPAFPFRVFYSDKNIRVFIIENLGHNFEWLKRIKKYIKKTDYFFVIVGCFYSEHLVIEGLRMIENLSLDIRQFRIMYNDNKDKLTFDKHGFYGEIINQNGFINENIMKPIKKNKDFNAIYVARLITLKRHELAAQVSNLALVAGDSMGTALSTYIPPHIYLNDHHASPQEVCELINRSYCGLILSEVEGASFVSSEYLLCGIPVVSTTSLGGRDFWYDEYNSLVVEPLPEAVRDAVEFFVSNPRDPEIIRNNHIKLATEQKEKFISMFRDILSDNGIDYIDPSKYFFANYFHKMRVSYDVNVESVFNTHGL